MATITTVSNRRTASGFGPLEIAITILVALTAIVHLFLGVSLIRELMGPPEQVAADGGSTKVAIFAFLFLCCFSGYVVLVVALNVPVLRRLQQVIRRMLIGYAALTIVAYFAKSGGLVVDPIGLTDKAIEIALIVLLVIEGRRPLTTKSDASKNLGRVEA